MVTFDYLFMFGAVATAAVATGYDLKTGHIPNWLTLGSLVSGVGAHVIRGGAQAALPGAGAGAVNSLLGIVLCSLIPVLLYRVSGMGGGDVKLLGAMGALLGPMLGLETQYHSFIGMSLFALASLAYQGRLLATLQNCSMLLINPFRSKEQRKKLDAQWMTSFRFAPAVLVGACVTVLAHWSPP